MNKWRWFMAISLIVLALVWWQTRADGKMRVIFCEVGQGDGILITKSNFQMLIDTGSDNRKVLGCLEKWAPVGDKEIEVVLITHWDKDHSGGLRGLIDNYKIDSLYSGVAPKEENEQKFYTGSLVKNDIFKFGLMKFEVLNPDRDWGNDNDNSVVGILSYKDCDFLLTGDASAQVEQKLVWRNELRQTRVLKISHHGSAGATSEELLKKVHPEEAVISVGKNSFGHPSGEVMERLRSEGVKVRRTDQEGDIMYVCQ